MLKPCECKHDYQDQRYGKGIRVFNPRPSSKTQGPSFRCTVCERIK